jgi:hypothetical protein
VGYVQLSDLAGAKKAFQPVFKFGHCLGQCRYKHRAFQNIDKIAAVRFVKAQRDALCTAARLKRGPPAGAGFHSPDIFDLDIFKSALRQRGANKIALPTKICFLRDMLKRTPAANSKMTARSFYSPRSCLDYFFRPRFRLGAQTHNVTGNGIRNEGAVDRNSITAMA